MHVVLAGASGFLGSHLRPLLEEHGHQVTPLVRRPARSRESSWDPYSGHVDHGLIADADVVINLAGSPTAGNPHSRKWAKELEQSRVTTTGVLAQAIANAPIPLAFLAGNGISYYGDHGSQVLDESAASKGSALLTKVTRAWQAATQPASDAGARVAILRTAPVMDERNAPLKLMLPVFRSGLGARIGSGQQYFPMISLRDWVAAVGFLTEQPVSGPVNLCCESTPTNAEFTTALAELTRRRALMRTPASLVKVAAGPMAPEVLGSMNTKPVALLTAGYSFADQGVREVLQSGING